ncbi:hypothetical protein AHAS_Ahas09G0118200 [Arachis hypogaea]
MAENTAARFMCSFGGQIRHHDGGGSNNHQHFFYYGGNNRILEVDRNISFHDLTAELSALCGGAAINFFKYLIPGDDLDTLVTVTNDRDLGYMMREYDLHFRGSASADRMRIFLFFDPVHNGRQCHGDDDSDSSVDVDIDVVAVGGGDGCRRGGDGYNGGDGGGVVVVVIVTVISVLMSAVVHRDGDGVEVVGGVGVLDWWQWTS